MDPGLTAALGVCGVVAAIIGMLTWRSTQSIATTSSAGFIFWLVSAAGLFRLSAAGWLMLQLGLVYLVFGAAHLATNYSLLLSRSPARSAVWPFFSSVLFLAAMLVQYDFGDGPSWYTITTLFAQSSFAAHRMVPDALRWPDHPILQNVAMFVPVALTWVLFLWKLYAARLQPNC